jgi:hypothetical protein
MNEAIIWDIAPRSPYENWHFRGAYHLHCQEVICSFEVSVHMQTMQCCISEDGNFWNKL